jgi:hypothetical protein
MEYNEKEIKIFYPNWNKNHRKNGFILLTIYIIAIVILLGFYFFIGALEPIAFNIFDNRGLFLTTSIFLTIGITTYCIGIVLIKMNVEYYYKLFINKFSYLEDQGLKPIKPKEISIYFDDIKEIKHNEANTEHFSFLILLKKKKKYPDIFVVDSIDDLNLILNTYNGYKKSIQ